MKLSFWLTRFLKRRASTSVRSRSVRSRLSSRHPGLHSRVECCEPRLVLTTFIVNSLLDLVDVNPGDGIAQDANGNTTLRAAIQEANALAGDDIIQLPAGIVQLTLSGRNESEAATGDLDITSNITLTGAGSADTIIDMNGFDRVFEVFSGAALTLQGVTIREGLLNSSLDEGAGIRNLGTLVLEDSAMTQHSTAGGGGAISNETSGSLTVRRTRFTQNSATGVAGGGVILNRGSALLEQIELTGNSASFNGGGISNLGSGATLTLRESTLDNNQTGLSVAGGGLFNTGTATVERSLFVSNLSRDGGGIWTGSGSSQLTVINSTFSANVATRRGGGLHIADENDQVLLRHVTMTLNLGANAGGGVFRGGKLEVENSIIAGNSTNGSGPDVASGLTSLGHNLFGSTVGGSIETDLQDVDPQLGALLDNGGPTRTHRPLPGSPAIDGTGGAGTDPVDQRNLPRPFDADQNGVAAADIGAFEVQPTVFVLPPGGDITIILNGEDLQIIDNTDQQVLDSQPLDSIVVLELEGSGADDSITIDLSGGDPFPPGGIIIRGGGQGPNGDALTLQNGGVSTVTQRFIDSQSGSITLSDGTGDRLVQYEQMEAIFDLLSASSRVFEFPASADQWTLADNASPLDGLSRLISVASSVPVTFLSPASLLEINSGDGGDSGTLAGADSGLTAVISVAGEDGSDVLDASAMSRAVTLTGGDGNDSIIGGDGADLLNGDAGADTILGGNGNDTLNGGSEKDQLFGEGGDDAVFGQGSSGDTVSGGPGNDLLNGGGNDRLIETGDVDFVLTNTQLTGLGTDTLVGITSAILNGGAGNNRLDASAFTGFALLYGQGGHDELIGGPGTSYLDGSSGNDTLSGHDGNDSLFGGSGSDLLLGGNGNDLLEGQESSNDTLTGGAGDDTLRGGTGNDMVVDDGDASVTFIGPDMNGLGADRVFSVERIRLAGGPGHNLFDFRAYTGRLIAYGLDGNDTILGGLQNDLLSGGPGHDDLRGGPGSDSLFGDAGFDTLNGGEGDDSLDGGDDHDGLSGWTGNDTLVGARGKDTLYGGDGNDWLFGGAAADTLQGGSGADTLDGGDGADRLTGGSGTGTADPGDILAGPPGEIDEAFQLNPLPDWIDAI